MYYRNNTQVITKIFCDASFCMGVDWLNNGRSTQEVFCIEHGLYTRYVNTSSLTCITGLLLSVFLMFSLYKA